MKVILLCHFNWFYLSKYHSTDQHVERTQFLVVVEMHKPNCEFCMANEFTHERICLYFFSSYICMAFQVQLPFFLFRCRCSCTKKYQCFTIHHTVLGVWNVLFSALLYSISEIFFWCFLRCWRNCSLLHSSSWFSWTEIKSRKKLQKYITCNYAYKFLRVNAFHLYFFRNLRCSLFFSSFFVEQKCGDMTKELKKNKNAERHLQRKKKSWFTMTL